MRNSSAKPAREAFFRNFIKAMEARDTNREEHLLRSYMRLVTLVGAVIVLISICRLQWAALNLQFALLALITLGLASRAVVKLPGVKSNVSVSDTLILLTLLIFDAEAAVLLGAADAFFGSLRITKRPLMRAFNSAAMACSVFLTAWILRLVFGSITDLVKGEYSSRLIIATCMMALTHYFVNSALIAIAGALKAKMPIWQVWKKYYIYTSVSYFAGASAASITVKLIAQIGLFAFLAVLPVVAIVYLTYVTYLKNVEASAAQAEQAKRYIEELQEKEERFRSAFDYAPIGMALVSPSGQWLQVNRSLCEIVGYSEQELLNMNFQQITHCDDLNRFLCNIERVLAGEVLIHPIEMRYVHRRGQEVWALVGISLVRDSQNRCPHLILQIQDITDRKRAEQQLLHEALHDPLTGLPNRAWFMEQLRLSLDQLKHHKDRLNAVLFLDLDRFKVINDSIGHMIGDRLLIGIADRLQKCLRPEDKVARLGGDEFTVLIEGLKEASEAVEVAERIQREIAKPFKLHGYETFTTVSIGIALSSSAYDRPEDLLRDADTAMYQAKSLGKAQYVIFDKDMHARAMSLLQLETDLRRAIDRREFFIQYQPIVSLSSGKLTGFEALVRWHHPDRGLIPPEEFIALAEETGFVVPIGQWVLREACRQMRWWQQQFPSSLPLSISVNLSSKQFAHSSLIEQIVRTLNSTGLDPRSLKLEITESVVMENVEVATRMLEQLRALGVELSIDDFGTGYSSLSYLHRLPIDTLKIDRSFVGRICENNENREIVRTIIMLAQNLGMSVIAEGVETKEQLKELRELKCQAGQGYLFSRPLNADEATVLITKIAQGHTIDTCLEELYQEDLFGKLASQYSM
jgi:diguanylate cyclase (GGDEF)-like protein/PAS domain S-box-containing protein